MKSVLILAALSTVFALPQNTQNWGKGGSEGGEGGDGDVTDAYDGFSFRVGHLKGDGDKNYILGWVAGQPACNQRDNIGGGMTSFCDSGRWSKIPYADSPTGNIKVQFQCDSSDTQYGHVTYRLESGKEGVCTTSQETFQECPGVVTILNCTPSKDNNGSGNGGQGGNGGW